MKKILTLLMIIGLAISSQIQAQVSISTTCNDPDASAMLDVQSTDKGMLIPRMTATEMSNIASPATGLVVFNTTESKFYYYMPTTGWIPIDTDSNDGDAWGVTGEDQTSDVVRTGSVGIGVSTPEEALHIARNQADGDADPIFHTAADSRTGKSNLILRKSRGTVTSPAAVQENDMLGSYDSQGYDGDSFDWGGNMIFAVDSAVSTSSTFIPTRIEFRTDFDDPKMVVKYSGNVGIGTILPEEKLEVDGHIRMTDGNEASGKVMMSDAEGTASWTDPSTLEDSDFYAVGTNSAPNNINENLWTQGSLSLGNSTGVNGAGTYAAGTNSFAGGTSSYAGSDNSFAFGYQDTVSGSNGAIAMGYRNRATGNNTSVAIGRYNEANGSTSSAYGSYSVANGNFSTVGGERSITSQSAVYGFAYGYQDTVTGNNASMAMGFRNKAAGNNASVAMGYYNEANGNSSSAFGSHNVVNGVNSIVTGYLNTVNGRQSFVGGMESVTTSSADYGFAFGSRDTVSGGNSSVAIGHHNKATGTNASMALGYYNQANGKSSTTLGSHNIANADNSTVIGYQNIAEGKQSFVGGEQSLTTSTADYGFVFGYHDTVAGNNGSIAMGIGNRAKGNNASIALGYFSIANGKSSIALGSHSIANGEYTFATGYLNTADGAQSFVGGIHSSTLPSANNGFAFGYYDTVAGTNGSIAMGYLSKAFGNHSSVAIGNRCIASGRSSLSMGTQTTASGEYSSAFGRGIKVSGSHSMAIAISDQTGVDVTQNNTMAIMGGKVGIGTISPDEKFEVEFGDPNIDVEIGVGTSDTDVTFITLRSPNGTKYYITVSDLGVIQASTSKP